MDESFLERRYAEVYAQTEALLFRQNVSLARWGTGEARTLRDLVNEILQGEATLDVDQEGKVVRTALGVAIHVFYRAQDGAEYYLVEDRQEYKNGNVRRRGDIIKMSIGEKRKAGELVWAAVERAFEEELQMHVPYERCEPLPLRDIRTPSKAFPGIDTRYVTNMFRIVFTEGEINPEGYVEVQKDKTTFFVWKRVEPT